MNKKFDELYSINVNDKTENKQGLTYLSWAWAWAEFKKHCPDASYEIKFFDGKPFVYDNLTGYMVFTSVTADGITHDMWLPVMDANNRAMKAEPYVVKTKYKDITVAPATMFDINKTIMRCLTKNLAMFGLGLYIYAGEDLPEVEEEAPKEEKKPEKKTPQKETRKAAPKVDSKPITKEHAKELETLIEWSGADIKSFLAYFKVESIIAMNEADFEVAREMLDKKIAKQMQREQELPEAMR